MYSTYDGAKRRAQTLASLLAEAEVPIPLHACQRALACAGGYRDWIHLRQALANGVRRPADLKGFLRRFVHALPDETVGPAYRWAEGLLWRQRERAKGKDGPDHEMLDWFARVEEYMRSIGVVHRVRTALLMPGSGSGQRLRQNMVAGLCVSPAYPQFDRTTFVLTFEGSLETLMPREADHPNFAREFARLCDAGIFEWDEAKETLRLNPPPLDRVHAHIARCREHAAEYWREAA